MLLCLAVNQRESWLLVPSPNAPVPKPLSSAAINLLFAGIRCRVTFGQDHRLLHALQEERRFINPPPPPPPPSVASSRGISSTILQRVWEAKRDLHTLSMSGPVWLYSTRRRINYRHTPREGKDLECHTYRYIISTATYIDT